MWQFLAQAGLQALDSFLGSDSQRKANLNNRRLQKEQQAWEQMMSNSAVQRRKADIIAAGGNPALAFTTGSEASTPSVAPARMEATYKPGGLKDIAMNATQRQNVAANTALQLAQAKKANVEANVAAATESSETSRKINRNIEEYEWDDIKTRLLRTADTTSALQAKKLGESLDSLIAQAKIQAEKGSLDLKQLRSTIEAFGLGADQKANIIQKLMQILLPLIKD